MKKVLPSAVYSAPPLNLRQGIKSSLNHWRQLISSLYLFYLCLQDERDVLYGKESVENGKTVLMLSDAFAAWLDAHCGNIPNVKEKVLSCPLYSAQMEHLQVGLELFLKLAKVDFVDATFADGKERTGGSRYCKALRFGTNMKILADMLSAYDTEQVSKFLEAWLMGADDREVGEKVKSLLVPFTEECQYKIRSGDNEIFFQEDGIYSCLRDSENTVESSDSREPVGPFRILKSYVKEGMHPYLTDGSDGFEMKTSASHFISYADMVRTTLSLRPQQTVVYQDVVPDKNENGDSPSLLPLALRLFAERRVGEWRDAGREVNAKVRDYFAALTAEKLDAFGDDQITELFCGVKDADGKVVFSPMWSGTPGSGWGNIKPSSAAETKAVRDFLVRLRSGVGAAAEFRQDGFDHPKGFGPAVVSELLMKFHPKTCFKHGQTTFEVLTELGLVKFDHPFKNDFSDADYKQVCGVAAKLLAAMCEMKLPRSIAADGTGDGEVPDYLTVNEFVWFVNENKELIMQEWSKNMKHEIKLCPQTPVNEDGFAAFIRKFIDAVRAAGLAYDDSLVKRFVCALLAKPFVVLTGLSGSGKTKLAQSFAQWIAADGTWKIVSVGADWTNSEKLLGYPNALDPNGYVLPDTGVLKLLIDANDNPSVPFFLVLDEMNLSHVERYFADFLSAMESAGEIRLYDGEKVRRAGDGTPVPPSIPFPKNLFVIGTMNVDETTHAFSPKVLDRAQVIEFRVNEEQINAFLDRPTRPDLAQIAGKGGEYAAAFLRLHENPIPLAVEDKAKMGEPLKRFFPVLAELGAEFAFRTAGEALAFCGFALKSPMSADEAVDAAVMQKLLPKLHGSRRRLAAPLEAFWGFCRKPGNEQTIADVCKKDAAAKVADVARFPVSAEKIRRLYKAADQNGFASYAEA